MDKYVKAFTGSSIAVNKLAAILDNQNVRYIIKDHEESGRLAGFGTAGAGVEIHIHDVDVKKAVPIITDFRS